jgi:hypothetical protein
VIKNDQLNAVRETAQADFVGLARANKQSWVGAVSTPRYGADNLSACGLCERNRLFGIARMGDRRMPAE